MRISGLGVAGAAVVGAFILAGCATGPSPPPGIGIVPANIIASVSDPGRPAADTARDVAQRPSQLLAFAGVRAGDKVVDLIPAGGYFTRLFSMSVGAKGKVYAYVPDELTKLANPPRDPAVALITRDPAYANSVLYLRNLSDFVLPEKVDLIFIGHHYHDMKSAILGPVDLRRFSAAAFAALKPGGAYVVVDFAAEPGATAEAAAGLGRVDPALVKAEASAAGFVFMGETNLLSDPTDSHTARAQEGVAGKSDQFAYRFLRPR